MRNSEQVVIFQLETFRTDRKEASAYDAELRTDKEFPAGKFLEQIKTMTEAGAGVRFRTDIIFLAGPKLESIYFREEIRHNFCLEQIKNFQVADFYVRADQ